MPTALFLSPHLDDVAFSCGGTLLRVADNPAWRVVLCSVFTESVENPQGFALRCQTDKGIAPEVDYMALRRAEDAAFAEAAGVDDAWHWELPEAPHRGYESPAELFAGERPDDAVWQPVRDALTSFDAELQPDLVFAPQGLGNHVDHLQTIRAVLGVYPAAGKVLWYRDTPYAIREPSARPAGLLDTAGLTPRRVPLPEAVLARKIDGCCRYVSQVGFQFGGADGVREKLTAFHRTEAGGNEGYAETFLGAAELSLPL